MTFNRDCVERAKKGEIRLLQFITVEVTVGKFQAEPVKTIYLRDCTEYVRAIKTDLKADKKRMKKQFEEIIIRVVADLSRAPGKQVPTNMV